MNGTGSASITSSGVVTGVKVGNIVVSATGRHHTASTSIQVTFGSSASVSLSPATDTDPIVVSSETLQLSALLLDYNGNSISPVTFVWTVTDTAGTATID